MKKLIPILLAVFVLLTTQVALGAEVTKLSASGKMSPAAYETISDGQCSIANNGDGTIRISGSTSTRNTVDEIGLALSLQRYSNGKWSTLKKYSFTKNGSDYVFGGKVISVSKGYNYRVIAQHKSLNDGISESGQSYSESLYIQ